MAGTLRFTRLRFRAGPAPAQDALDIEPATVVVLVGPNNSGKSLALREIETWCTSSEQARKVIDTIEVDFPTDIETAKALLEPFIAEASEDPVSENGEVSLDWNFIMHRPSLGPGQPMQGDRFFQKQINLSMERNLEGNMRSYLTRWHTIRLDGR